MGFAMLTISEFAKRYTDSRQLSADYAATLRKRAAALEAFTGKRYLPDVLTEDNVNAFLKSLTGSPYTVAKYRQDFLCLWRSAADDDYVAYPLARRIWRPKTPPTIINCYTIDEVRKLVAATDKLKGAMPNGIPRKRYWRALLMLGWATGLRRGDLWKVKPDDVRPDGSLPVVQNKTGRIVLCHVDPKTLEAVRNVGSLKWPLCMRAFAIHFAEIIRLSEVNRGVFKWVRRSSGSYIESTNPGMGFRHLGHATETTFAKHYDAKVNPMRPPQPPEL